MADQLLNTLAVTAKVEAELSKSRFVRIVMPFVTLGGVGVLLERIKRQPPKAAFCLELLTRFDAESILAGICELEALRSLMKCQSLSTAIEIRRLDHLHAKCFIFDKRSLIVGSSNLTLAGQTSNIELGSFSSNRASIDSALLEFDTYWQKSLPISTHWIDDQERILSPFLKRYQALRSEMSGLMVLQSIRMPNAENDFLASLKSILKKAGSAKGASRAWLEEEMLRARRSKATEDAELAEDEPKLNVRKRIIFLELLGLIRCDSDVIFLTDFGRECASDEKILLKRMAATFPILVKTYQATFTGGLHIFKDIAHVDPDPRRPADPSQTLRNAVHWLTAFGLLQEEKVGSTYQFRRRKGTRANLLLPYMN